MGKTNNHQQKGELSEDQPRNINHEARFTEKIVKSNLRNVASHHVESFNYAMETCLPRINQYMLTAEITQPKLADGAKRSAGDTTYPFNKMSIWFEDFSLK